MRNLTATICLTISALILVSGCNPATSGRVSRAEADARLSAMPPIPGATFTMTIGDDNLCRRAILDGAWEYHQNRQNDVKEAKRRGLDCPTMAATAATLAEIVSYENFKELVWKSVSGVSSRTTPIHALIFSFEGHSSFCCSSNIVQDVDFSPNGREFLSANWDHSAKLWNLKERSVLKTFDARKNPFPSMEWRKATAFSPDGKYFAIGDHYYAGIYEAATHKLVHKLLGFEGVVDLNFSPDSQTLLTIDYSGTVILWESKTGYKINTFESGSVARSIDFSPDGKFALVSNAKNKTLWNVSLGRAVRKFAGTGGVVAFSPNGKHVLLGTSWSGAELRLWNFKTGRLVRSYKLQGYGNMQDAVFTPNGRHFLTGSTKKNIALLWNVKTGRLVNVLEGHKTINNRQRGVSSVAISPNGRYALTGGYDGRSNLWLLSFKRGFELIQEIAEEELSLLISNYAGEKPISSGPYESTIKFEQRKKDYHEKVRSYPKWWRNKSYETAFRRVFGGPKIVNVSYDADLQEFYVDVEASGNMANNFQQRFTLDTKVPNKDAASFEQSLRQGQVKITLNFGNDNFNITKAEFLADQQVFAAEETARQLAKKPIFSAPSFVAVDTSPTRPRFTPRGPSQIASPAPSPKHQEKKVGGTGTGFLISDQGHVVSNEHVVRGCRKIVSRDGSGQQRDMLVISKDNETDLALLEPRNSVPQKLHQKNFGSLRDSDVELGEKLLVSGYPFGDALSSSLKVTTGVVSSTLGLFNNVAQFQMDAAIQPGNSGGPIYDDRGNIVGVVVSRLNKISMLKASGTLPENTNFGIKSSSVLKFVRAAGIEAASSARDKELSSTLISKRAQDETVMLTCKQ